MLKHSLTHSKLEHDCSKGAGGLRLCPSAGLGSISRVPDFGVQSEAREQMDERTGVGPCWVLCFSSCKFTRLPLTAELAVEESW